MISCSRKNGSPEKGPLWQKWYSSLLPGSRSLAWLCGNVQPHWHSQHTIARRYYRCSFLLDCVCQELAKSCILVLLTFHLPHSLQHSECCKCRSQSVVSVTMQCIFFAGLSSAAGIDLLK